MGDKLYETRHLYLAVGLCLLVFSPIILLFVPQTIAQILHYTDSSWYVFTPDINYVIYGVGLFFVFVATLIIFFLDITRKAIILSMVSVLISLFFFFIGSQSYKELGDNTITYSPITTLKEYTYTWDDIEAIRFYENLEEETSRYEMEFSDGRVMMLKNDNYFRHVRWKFFRKMREEQVLLETVEEPV